MHLMMKGFGGFKESTIKHLKTKTVANGGGKTTTINAYVFALTGKTIDGFTPRNKYAIDGEKTAVWLYEFLNFAVIQRVLTDKGSQLYIGGEITTQTDFNDTLKDMGYDLAFIVTCVQANILTSDSLDTDTLRKILSITGVMNNEDHVRVKKDIANVNKQIKNAEKYALSNVTVPPRTVKPLSIAERHFVNLYKYAKKVEMEGVQSKCPTCGREHEANTVEELTREYDAACVRVKEDVGEFVRLTEKEVQYGMETDAINLATLSINNAAKARKDVVQFKKTLEMLQADLKTLDEADIKEGLPEYVEVITEVPMKNGNVKSTCTLEYNGIPLKSINRARRIQICVAILDHARTTKGMQAIPIIVDNAEAVDDMFEGMYGNVISFGNKNFNHG